MIVELTPSVVALNVTVMVPFVAATRPYVSRVPPVRPAVPRISLTLDVRSPNVVLILFTLPNVAAIVLVTPPMSAVVANIFLNFPSMVATLVPVVPKLTSVATVGMSMGESPFVACITRLSVLVTSPTVPVVAFGGTTPV